MVASVQSYRTVYPLIARTATPTAVTQSDKDHARTGGHFVIDVTAIGAAPSVVPTIQALDSLSGKWYTLLTGAALVAVGTTVLKVFPTAPVAANLSAPDLLPPFWRVVMTHGNADSITYSVSAWLSS